METGYRRVGGDCRFVWRCRLNIVRTTQKANSQTAILPFWKLWRKKSKIICMLRKYVVTLHPLWWRKYFWKARFLRKVFRKNLSKRFGSYRKTSYLCTRFDEDNTSRTREFLRRFRWWKNSSKRFGSYQKTSYLCTRFDEDNTSRTRKFLGRFDDEKNLSKRFGDLKNLP
mgnify:CR=1 FL=1